MSEPMWKRIRYWIWMAILLGGIPVGAIAQGHVEKPHDPYLPGRTDLQPAGGNPVVRGPYRSVQVNVNAQGQNIPGDAANEPSMAVDPMNPQRMVIGWRQFDNIASNFRQAGWAYSHDGGQSWTFPGRIDAGVFRSDPVIETDANGNFYYNSLRVVGNQYTVQVFRSTNGGMTWTQQADAFGGDKQWFTIDRTNSSGRGHIYQSWSVYAGCCGNNQFNRSVDGNTTWQTPIAIPRRPIWGTLAVSSQGELYIGGVNASNRNLFSFARSSNARNRLVTPSFDLDREVNLGGILMFGGVPNPGGLLGQVWVDVDVSGGPRHGTVYMLCSVDPPGDDPMDVHIVRSTDGGSTWSAPVRVNESPSGTNAWQWFGTMAVAPNGRLDVVWNDTRSDSSGLISELYYAYSLNGGSTWSVNVPISPSFASTVGWPNQNKIGDYYDLHSDSAAANVAYSATFNGEQDVYFVRVGDCNENGVHDSEDLASRHSTDRNRNGILDECEVPAGDVNFDGCVDDQDLLAVLFAFGTLPCDVLEDLNADCLIDDIDLLIVLFNFGAGC
jgi:hypothetical protein